MVLLVIWETQCVSESETRSRLRSSLKEVVSVFSVHQVKVWLEFHTLLGTLRERDVIEPSVANLGILSKDCDQLLSGTTARERLLQLGFQVDHRSTQPRNQLLFPELLHTPCMRIVDPIRQTSIDIYPFSHIATNSARELDKQQNIILPPNYKFEEALLCLDDSGPTSAVAGCRLLHQMFPLKSVNLCSHWTLELCDISTPRYLVPNKAMAVLYQLYPDMDDAIYVPSTSHWGTCDPASSTCSFLTLVSMCTILYSLQQLAFNSKPR